MKRISFLLFALLLILTACSQIRRSNYDPTKNSLRLFVATNGNDSWSGKLAKPNSSQSDGPFRTVSRALQASESSRGATILIHGGTHFLEQPVVVRPENSGTAEKPLLIAAYQNERPILSAGRRIAPWIEARVDGKPLWAASVPETRSGWFFHQLWVNGERRTRARHPNSGCLAIAALPDTVPSWEHGNKRFQFKAGDLKNWRSVTNGEAIAMARWVESRMPITSIDEEKRILTSNKRSVFQLDPGNPYYLEHIFETLDEPGEWYLDQEQGVLYYWPMPAENLANFEAIAPMLSDCLRIEGNTETEKFVENVHFRDLTFAHNEWYYPSNFGSTERHISTTPDPEIYGSSQAAFVVPGAVRAEAARHCVFENCTFKNIGSYGLQLGHGCQSNLVSACEFSDLAAGGIRLGETILRTNAVDQAHDNVVSDCEISDGGQIFCSGEGIWIGQSFNNKLEHNSIHDFFYTGISIGWTWGYKPSLASNNVVEFNEVHHIGRKSNGDGAFLGDMGIIYTLGQQPGTVIRNNYFHDVAGRYFGWGIYFDEGSSFILAENNVVSGTTHGGFHQHYGKENILRNNVFAFGRDQQLQRSVPEQHSSFSFQTNIVYFNTGKLLEGDWNGGKLEMDNNVFFDVRTNSPGWNFPSGLEAWRKNGRDNHSVIADPLFTTTNFTQVASNSPALQLGFKPIDLRTVGPRKKVGAR